MVDADTTVLPVCVCIHRRFAVLYAVALARLASAQPDMIPQCHRVSRTKAQREPSISAFVSTGSNVCDGVFHLEKKTTATTIDLNGTLCAGRVP